jgi:TolA-binding protein
MRTPSLVLALALSLTACGGPSDPAALNDGGYQALGSGDYAEAATEFDAALTAIGDDTSNPQYARAMWGLIEALTHIDPDRAEDDFLAFAKANSATMSADDYGKVGTWLADAKKFVPAAHVIEAGIEAYPEAPSLLTLKQNVKQRASTEATEEEKTGLEGIGYIGDE